MKYYILHRGSYFGMGSNVDEYLLSEDELHAIWTDEEIRDKLENINTYSRYNDLVALPQDAAVIEEHTHMEKVVFHIWNQFGYMRDIIVGEADFTKRIVDLTHSQGVCDFESGEYVEFTAFDFKRILEMHYFLDSIDYLIESSYDRKERSEEGLQEKDQKPWRTKIFKDHIREDEAIIEKFSKPIDVPDDYMSHMYKGRLADFRQQMWDDDMEEMSKIDYRTHGFIYPLCPDMGGEYTHHREVRKFYGLDELFDHGADCKSKFFAYTGSAEELGDLEGINVPMTLCDTFAYD